METTDRNALEGKLIPELQKIATSLGIEGTQRLRKSGLIDAIVAQGDGNGSEDAAPNPFLEEAKTLAESVEEA